MPLVPAAYPMVDESEATGLVAVVYRDVLSRFPMVPSLYKSLAVCPVTLALAWEQSRPALDDGRLADAADRLVAAATGVVPRPPGEEVRATLGAFVSPIARMLVVVAGLSRSLDGRVDGPPAAAPVAPDNGSPTPRPERTVPPTSTAAAAERFGEIRRDLATPIINSIWRTAAREGVLDAAWTHLGAATRSAAFADRAGRVQEAALEEAAALQWSPVASPAAFSDAGAADALPGAVVIVDAYLVTLARVLPLVAGLAAP